MRGKEGRLGGAVFFLRRWFRLDREKELIIKGVAEKSEASPFSQLTGMLR